MRAQDKETRILFASVLKPMDEPRMCERMGQSLVDHGFKVFITGFPASSDKPLDSITFLPHKRFKRISINRIKVRFSVLRKALSIKPDFLIISTHELIGIAILFKLFTGKKIIYDVQEDYWQNIMYTNAWPRVLRPLIAFPVRWKEWITSPFFSTFLLAEKCYQEELRFARGKSVVIENKCAIKPGFQRKPRKEIIQLVFTGTIGESTGIFEAILLAKKLHAFDPRVRLTIIGQCSQLKTLRRVEAEISGHLFINLVGGNDFVPHDKILDAIRSANFGIISYPPSPHTKDKIPSKLYEYLAYQLPILLTENSLWASLSAPSNAAVLVDFQKPTVDAILNSMHKGGFYAQKAENVDWRSEEHSLLTTIRSVL